MFHPIISRPIPRFLFICLGLLLPLSGLQGAAKGGARLRLICVSSLPGEQKIVLASRSEKGRWSELGDVELRASNITDWLPAKAGELHLAVRQDRDLKSICGFQYPANSRGVLVALVADTETNSYKAHVLDLDRIEFAKGSVLVVNFSEKNALVSLGTNEQKIEPGQQAVVKPGNEEDATYRQLVSSLDDGGKPVPCHDRHVLGNADSREMLFVLSDKTLGLRVATLPLFGSAD